MDELQEFLLYCEMRNLSRQTVRWYGDMLARFFERMKTEFGLQDAREVETKHVRSYIKYLMDRQLSANTVNGYLRALKAFYKYFVEEGYVSVAPTRRIPLQKVPQKTINTFDEDQLKLICAAFDKRKFNGIRNYTMTRFLLDTGVRLSEMLNLQVEDISLKQRWALIRHGKGDKERYVPFGQQLTLNLATYLRRRANLYNGHKDNGVLFPSMDTRNALNRHTYYRDLQEVAKAQGVTGVRISPHTLRHTFAKACIMKGCDLLTLQQIMGHADTVSTRRYVNLRREELREQHDKFSPLDGLCGD